LAVFILKNLKTELFTGNAWLTKKINVHAQNIIKDVSITIKINMPMFVCGEICTAISGTVPFLVC